MIRWKVVRVNQETKEMESSFSPPGFKKVYRVGETTKADPETLGIMVFERKKDAKEFKAIFCGVENFRLLKVEAIGKGKKPKIIASGTTTDQFRFITFYKKLPNYKWITLLPAWSSFAPKGTICYPEIKVLSVDKKV